MRQNLDVNELIRLIRNKVVRALGENRGEWLLTKIDQNLENGSAIELRSDDGQVIYRHAPIVNKWEELEVHIETLESYFLNPPSCIHAVGQYFKEYWEVEAKIDVNEEILVDLTFFSEYLEELRKSVLRLKQVVSELRNQNR